MRVQGARATVTLAVVALLATGCRADGGSGAVRTTAPPVTASGQVRDWRSILRLEGRSASASSETRFVSTDASGFETSWDDLGLRSDDRPAVDFEREIAVVWSYGVSGSCSTDTVTDVEIDAGSGLVRVVLTDPYGPDVECSADYVPVVRVVAIDRDVLPPPPFELVVPADCNACRVTVDSTEIEPLPGSAWREIATVELSPVGERLRPYLAADAQAWEALADELQIDRDGLDVDFGSDVVIVWAYGISGSCNEDEIADVAIDMDAATVTLELAGDMWESATCTDDFNQRLRVTTVRRAALPTPPFDVVLPGNCVSCRLTVGAADL